MAVVRQTAHSAAEWRNALFGLLPSGRIWQEEAENPESEIYKEAQLWAQSLAELETEILAGLKEVSPLTAETTLAAWAKAGGLVYDPLNRAMMRILIVIAFNGSYTSTVSGFAGIAGMLGFRTRLEAIGGVTALCGSYECGQPLIGPSHNVQRTLWLHSDSDEFETLLAEFETEKLPLCGSALCGSQLWENEQQIHDAICKQSVYDGLMELVGLLGGLLPAHLKVLTRFE